jgi:hypothetical protein
MKTTIEIGGYVLSIEEQGGSLMVSAEKDGDVVEEFTLALGEEMRQDEDESDEDVKSFGEFEEEDDFENEDDEDESDDDNDDDNDDDDNDDDEEEDNNKMSLESFGKFITKRK